ncbi:MAG TPA: metalloregulator ArsR/SmtB family transcription factor [Verrucomicrobiae bacterium]|jgi:DNA-binding transcriptional ArsR family regulator
MTTESGNCAPFLKALASETRWQIVQELLGGELTVGEIGSRLKATQYNVSKHVRVLRDAGIISASKRGKHVHCEILPAFRRKMAGGGKQLDLGCCVFRFENESK